MEAHQQRVIDEKAALDEKCQKLSTFIKGDIFVNLPTAEQERLGKQIKVMDEYSYILGERIAAF